MPENEQGTAPEDLTAVDASAEASPAEPTEPAEQAELSEPVESPEPSVPAEPLVADQVLLDSASLAQRALLEVTPPETVGSVVGHIVEGEHVLTLLFAADLAGYPGWHWSVTIARVEDGEPTVVETELMPGERALLAPEWVPWSERLADYKAAQALAAAEAAESADDADEDEDDELDDHELDDHDDAFDGIEIDEHDDDEHDAGDDEHDDDDADDADDADDEDDEDDEESPEQDD